MKTLGVIGGGNMGEAIIAQCRQKYKIFVTEKDPVKARSLKRKYRVTCTDLAGLIKESAILLIAVKPQDLGDLLTQMVSVEQRHLVVSIAAGVTTQFIEKRLPERSRVVRAMPNMPAMIGSGMTALASGRYSTKTDLRQAQRIFENVGHSFFVKESELDAVTAISGSGPAYVFLFMEHLTKAARVLGLSENLAEDLVLGTFLGSAQLIALKKISPSVLREKVTSKGGTTQAALNVFAAVALEKIFAAAAQAAFRRAKELSRS